MTEWGVFAVDNDAGAERWLLNLYAEQEAHWRRNRVKRGRKPKRPRHTAEWRATRERAFARDDFTCRYCQTRGGRLECDHVIPVTRGGADADDNLVTACLPCNRSKGNKTLEEWRAA